MPNLKKIAAKRSSCIGFLMGQHRPILVYFRSFQMKILAQI